MNRLFIILGCAVLILVGALIVYSAFSGFIVAPMNAEMIGFDVAKILIAALGGWIAYRGVLGIVGASRTDLK